MKHLLINIFHGHLTAEHSGDGEVSTVSRITGSHHVLGVEHLLGELRDGKGAVLLRAAGSERSETGHEEVESGEGNLKKELIEID